MVNFDQISFPEIHTHHGRFRPNFALHAPLPNPAPAIPRQRAPAAESWPASAPQRHTARAVRLRRPAMPAPAPASPARSRRERLRRRRRGRGRDGRAAGAALSAYASVVSVEGESSDSRQISRNFALALTLANFVSNFAKSLHRARCHWARQVGTRADSGRGITTHHICLLECCVRILRN